MKTEGNLTSSPQKRTRRGRIGTKFGRAPLIDLAAARKRRPPFLVLAGERDVRRHKVGGHTGELAAASRS